MVPECANILDATAAPAQPVRIAIRVAGKVILTESSQVVCVESRGNRVLVRTLLGSHSASESVSALEQRLKPYGFVRIHRSTIVNEALVEEIRISKSGAMQLRVKGTDKEYSVSRKYRALVSRLAPAWF
ncbi:MAG: LytTR family DNA-binding domain-containing protein [Candidatus Acidiferrales bacterium]